MCLQIIVFFKDYEIVFYISQNNASVDIRLFKQFSITHYIIVRYSIIDQPVKWLNLPKFGFYHL